MTSPNAECQSGSVQDRLVVWQHDQHAAIDFFLYARPGVQVVDDQRQFHQLGVLDGI